MELYLAFVGATILLMLIPGPNVALIVANSIAYGPRGGLLTVAGTSAAMVPQLIVAGLGMAALLGALGAWLEWLRWAGVAYLLWLGLRHWRAPAADLGATRPAPPRPARLFGRGLLVSLGNPKTLLFYGAFFPQFISGDAPAGPQVALLAASFLGVAVTIDSGWALLAARARPLLAQRGRLANRLTGGLLIGAAAGLAMARREP